jgi:hypothetical protein
MHSLGLQDKIRTVAVAGKNGTRFSRLGWGGAGGAAKSPALPSAHPLGRQKRQLPSGIRVITDIDDTVKSSGGTGQCS